MITSENLPRSQPPNYYELIQEFLAATGARYTVEPKGNGRFEHKLILETGEYWLRRTS